LLASLAGPGAGARFARTAFVALPRGDGGSGAASGAVASGNWHVAADAGARGDAATAATFPWPPAPSERSEPTLPARPAVGGRPLRRSSFSRARVRRSSGLLGAAVAA